ncbi:class I SAM-dependent methyltransferase [Latilactobacillus fuchuensis]|uniref:class I SAM-dependent methyltransferase n=1 Tax=Latilactobacillus fuchuensis TaxID=164393 RepID=UPI000685623A|nr:class I SAM-dependent methyltransferase [Latilactobacillus fuchuensis]
MILTDPVQFAHQLLAKAIRPGDIVIDATVGYGHDTHFLAEKVADFGHVYGFDLQESALDICTDRLTKANLHQQVTLYNQGHERIITALAPDLKVQAAIFSLGILSAETATQTTLPNTTISAYHQILSRLNRGGLLVFVSETQFNPSDEEINYLVADLTHLNPDHYQVSRYQALITQVAKSSLSKKNKEQQKIRFAKITLANRIFCCYV